MSAFRRMSLTGNHSDNNTDNIPTGGRRGSIQDSLIQFSRNFKLGSGNVSKCAPELGQYLSRTTLQAVLANHLGDKKLKVRKITFHWLQCAIHWGGLRHEWQTFVNERIVAQSNLTRTWCLLSDTIMKPVYILFERMCFLPLWHNPANIQSCPLIITQRSIMIINMPE